MAVRVLIPTPLQRLTDNQAEVVIEGRDVREMIGNLEVKFPGVKARLCDEHTKMLIHELEAVFERGLVK